MTSWTVSAAMYFCCPDEWVCFGETRLILVDDSVTTGRALFASVILETKCALPKSFESLAKISLLKAVFPMVSFVILNGAIVAILPLC